MQSIFRLPWCSDQIAPKVSEKHPLENMRQVPTVDLSCSGLAQLKRKRTDSTDDLNSPSRASPKKQRADAPPQLPPLQTRLPAKAETAVSTQPLVAQPYATPLPTPRDIAHHDNSAFKLSFASPTVSGPYTPVKMGPETAEDLTPLQQVIDNEFNMQILMKHNELRLIEQELAKCQIALEQLRRCEVRPYPGMESASADISAGTGPAVAPPPGYTRPSHPAPHGVVDGPYSRHYRQWLLQDHEFDACPLGAAARFDGNSSAYARSTRNSGINRRPLGKSLAFSSNRSADLLSSLPNYPSPTPKDKSAPLILRRSTDNQLVKLICNNCLRGNFSSIQGFLNHCRIAHKVDYKSHDAAAIDCGRTLDEQEAANLPPETASAPAPKQSAARMSAAAPTMHRNLVHPMNTVGGAAADSNGARDSALRPAKVALRRGTLKSRLEDSPLKASAQAPRLSAHFAKHKLGGNLEQAIIAAKQKIDFGVDELASPDATDPESPSISFLGGRTVAGVFNAGSFAQNAVAARPPSRKGHREPAQRSRPSPLAPTMHQQENVGPRSPALHSPVASPHTADSNPGLVSDHEDDDHGSQSEDETSQPSAPPLAHSLGVRQECTDDVDIDMAVNDGMNEHRVVIRRNSMDAAAARDRK